MPGQDDVVYEFGSVRVEPAGRRLERSGEEISIPPRAFDALLLLVQQRGELVRKEDLLSRIWPDTHVEEAICRDDLNDPAGDRRRCRHQKYIQTISKSGYRFVGEVRTIRSEALVSAPKPEVAAEAAIEPPAVEHR